MAGIVSQPILGDDSKLAIENARFLQDTFGEDVYLEIQFNELEDQKKANIGIIKIANKLGIKYIITNDCHYVNKEDNEIHDALLLINSKNTYDDLAKQNAEFKKWENAGSDPDTKPQDRIWQFSTKELYFKTPDELWETSQRLKYKISKKEFDAGIKTTNEIADKIEKIEFDTSFKIVDIKNPKEEFLKQIKQGTINKNIRKKSYIDRLRKEIKVISDKGMINYFLCVADFVRYSKTQMMVGCGRGSGAGSLINYVLGITDIDPIRFNLSFERFLSKEREDLPDIDVDFEDQNIVKGYIRKKYGDKNVFDVANFGLFKPRSLIKDVARIHNIDFAEVNGFTKRLAMEIEHREDEETTDFNWLYNNVQIFKQFVDKHNIKKYVVTLLNKVRHVSRHAAGMIIYDDLYKKIPVIKLHETLQACYEKKKLEKLGFVKYDCLGLKTLGIINSTIKLVGDKSLHEKINPDNVDINDKKVLDFVFNDGFLIGIFQFDTKDAKKMIMDINVTGFEDLVAINAINRPALINAKIPDKFKRLKRKGRTGEIKIKILEPILKDTYGLMIYQEQIAEILNKAGNINLTDAHRFRKLSEKTDDKSKAQVEEIREKFFQNLCDQDIKDSDIKATWELLMKFSAYSFNRAHAVSYAMIAYQTAWLKTYYPLEFYTTLFKYYPLEHYQTIMNEYKKMGISVEPPVFNDLHKDFACNKEKKIIYFGLEKIKGLGEKSANAVLAISKNKNIKTFKDFLKNLGDNRRVMNKKIIETIIKCGIFRDMEPNMKKALDLYTGFNERINMSGYQKYPDRHEVAYNNTVKEMGIELDAPYADFPLGEKMGFERQYLGIDTGANLFEANGRGEKIKRFVESKKLRSYNNIMRFYCFSPTRISETFDKNDKKMAFVDGIGWDDVEISMIIFSSMYKHLKVERGKVYVATCFKDKDKLVLGKRHTKIKDAETISKLLRNIDDIEWRKKPV